MYKTVRQGENSLQYTILPQTEEVLSNCGLKGKGRDYSPSIHVRRSRRKSTVKYVLLIIFGIVVALALASLIPLYVMNGALLGRRSSQDHHESVNLPVTAPLAPAGRELAKSRKKELKISPDFAVTLEQKSETSTTMTKPSTAAPTAPLTVTGERASTPPWPMTALKSWKSSTSSTTTPPLPTDDNVIANIKTPSNNIRYQDTSVQPWEKDDIIRPTLTPGPMTIRTVFKYYSPSFVTNPPHPDVLITTNRTTTRAPVTTQFLASKLGNLKDDMLSAEDDDEVKESLEVDEVFSLPPSNRDFASPDNDSDEVTMSKTGDVGWYGARWPFVDTSSSIQWTVYTLGDNLLLPLLVAAISSIAFVLFLVLAVRRRKRTYAASAQIGKLTADLQADDNTNLLTAENAEDAEE